VIDRVSCTLRFGNQQSSLLRLNDSEKRVQRTIGLDTLSCVSLLLLRLLRLSVRLMGWISSKDGTGFDRMRFPEAPRPTAGIVLDGKMSATYG